MKLDKTTGFLVMMAFIIVIGLAFPYTLSLGKGVFSEYEIQDTIQKFIGIFVAGVLLTTIFWFINKRWKGNDVIGDNIGIYNIGEKPAIPFFKRFTAPQLTFLSVIVFYFLFYIGNITQFIKGSFVGMNFLPQQFSPLDSLLFSSLLTPTAENLLFAGVLGFLFFIVHLLFIKFKGETKDYSGYAYTLALFGSGALGVIWHISAYANSDVALGAVFTFWLLMGLMGLATGLLTVPLVFHIMNNFFIDFSRLYASDTIKIIMGVVWLAIVGIYFIIYRKRLFGRKE